MSRPSKGARLYLATGRIDRRSGKALPDVYFIRDGSVRISTGCGPDRLGEAEKALGAYLADKHTAQVVDIPTDADERRRRSDPAQVYVAEVVAYYAEHKAPKTADPGAVRARLAAITDWWGVKTLSDIRRSNCEAYVAARQQMPVKSFTRTAPRMVTAQGARRELEDLSAAVGYWTDEFHLTHRPKVVLPPKPESNRDALTRSQAAGLLLASMGWRQVELMGPWQPGEAVRYRWRRIGGSVAENRAHLRRFLLIGVYTGTRPGVIPKLLWEESPTQAWADLDDETIYRRGRDEVDHKTKRRPLVKIPRRLLAHMRRWKRLDTAVMAERKARELPTTNAVLHHGGRMIEGRIRRGFASMAADARIAEKITPHWQRHTAATWLMENGADLWKAAGFLGMTVKTLQDNYGHHRPDHQADIRNKVGSNRNQR